MTDAMKTVEVKVERTIPAPLEQVFDAWLDPKTPGTTWHIADEYVLDAKVGGLFFWSIKGTSHYGRFTAVQRPTKLQHTWMSPNTSGLESNVSVTFTKRGNETLMTLVHSGLPDTNQGKGHEKGWNSFLGNFCERFSARASVSAG
ncbi:MAG: SRPBCC domain-containing protein [Gemmatimonadetes bacterium]|nr:SRPBCC domain-containing protein [Gemmatimonadota bacterium]